jgi:hypothetical protein
VCLPAVDRNVIGTARPLVEAKATEGTVLPCAGPMRVKGTASGDGSQQAANTPGIDIRLLSHLKEGVVHVVLGVSRIRAKVGDGSEEGLAMLLDEVPAHIGIVPALGSRRRIG